MGGCKCLLRARAQGEDDALRGDLGRLSRRPVLVASGSFRKPVLVRVARPYALRHRWTERPDVDDEAGRQPGFDEWNGFGWTQVRSRQNPSRRQDGLNWSVRRWETRHPAADGAGVARNRPGSGTRGGGGSLWRPG